MKLLLENWRGYLNEVVQQQASVKTLFSNWIHRKARHSQRITGQLAYHLSPVKFDKFDDSYLGVNTVMGKAGEDMYNLDSYLGHMFTFNKDLLLKHIGKEGLGGRYLYTVKVNPGKVASMDIYDFKTRFPEGSEEWVKGFGQYMKQHDFGGVRYTNQKNPDKLMSDTVQVFSGDHVEILDIEDLGGEAE